MKTKKLLRVIVTLALLAIVATCFMVTAFADDLSWNLLTDADAGYRKELRAGWKEDTEEDGTVYVQRSGKGNALYIYDDNNILSEYRTFSLEGDFYFGSFPTGLRDGKTPEEKPLSFLCWIYGDLERSPKKFNALRIDSMGYLYTADGVNGRTNVRLESNTWYNIRCVFTPSNGVCEFYIVDEKMMDFTITKYDPETYTS